MYKRLTSAILTLILLAATAVGCTSQGGPEAGESASATGSTSSSDSTDAQPALDGEASPLTAAVQSVTVDNTPVSIVFWTGTSAANLPFLEDMVAAFQQTYPNITVDFSNQGPITELTDKITQNIVSRTTPTLSNLNAPTFPAYIASGAIVDLAPYYNDPAIGFTDDEKADFFLSYIAEVENLGPAGTMYGFPTNKKTTDVFAYNKTYFDAKGWDAPATWDQVAAYSKEIFEETGVPGFSYDTSYGDAAFKTLSTQWGSPYVSAGGAVDLDNDASRDAIAFYKSNMEAGYFTLPALMASAGGNNSSNGFVMEECYMFVGAAAGLPYAIPNPESGHKDFEVGVAPLPQKDSANAAAFSKGENYAIFASATDEERVAAWLLVKFLSSAEENVEWLVNTGNLPMRASIVENAEYKAFLETPADNSPGYYRAAAVDAALEMQDYMRYDITFDKADDLASAVGEMWLSIMVGDADVDDALSQAAAKFS